jgi:aminoglycoside phosphotransferase family enzyme
VAAIRKRDGRVSLDPGPGEKVEFAVKMKELPQEERMDHRIKESRVSESHVEDIAGILADFHAESGSPPGELGSPKVIKENFSPAFKAKSIMGKYFEAAGKVDQVKSRVDAFLRNNRELFQTRITEKRIKNCHGDVRTKNIFIHEDRIYLFDAIEFNTRISGCDVAAEIAFLAMDLDFYGRRDLGDVLLNSYISRTGDRDVHKLIDFYQCYRAMVEALVYAHLLADAEVSRPKKKDAVENCQEYLDLACRFSEKL